MERTLRLKNEFSEALMGTNDAYTVLKAEGYRSALGESIPVARATAIQSLFSRAIPHVYRNDLIVGSHRLHRVDTAAYDMDAAKRIVKAYGERSFATNLDHYCPDYARFLSDGIPGTLRRISESKERYSEDSEKLSMLSAMQIAMEGFASLVANHREAVLACLSDPSYDPQILTQMAEDLEHLTKKPPETFRQALQLTWLVHLSFDLEQRCAMALGRMDQYLYPYFQNDLALGRLTEEEALELLENVFMKIHERLAVQGGEGTINIAVGGTEADGSCSVNPLSTLIVRAVKNCNVPGPNLSARITHHTPDDFLDECLRSIGTGLGYPALMNDEVNMAALSRYGYAKEDVCNYSMVGCIENFMTGKQPPWSDGRFDTPKYLEYLFHHGKSYYGTGRGIDTGSVESIGSMEELMDRFKKQLQEGVKYYVSRFRAINTALNPKNYVSPFLSCFCEDCIGRGKDINDGGAVYPSVHGAALMGIATVADSLAAIERVVFEEKKATLMQLAEAMKANFVGFEELRRMLEASPKYGNDDDFVDKYAVWFVDFLSDEFDRYRTYDGGWYYTAIAANISNIASGANTGATPDGRLAGTPISDAASPAYGRDRLGPTATARSLTKPDYSRVACGSVVNQKFSPEMFSDEQRPRLLALVKAYFFRGGQEIQINATSRKILKDAMENPSEYRGLVVRVSGFSAYFVTLDGSVQMDILARTQHE